MTKMMPARVLKWAKQRQKQLSTESADRCGLSDSTSYDIVKTVKIVDSMVRQDMRELSRLAADTDNHWLCEQSFVAHVIDFIASSRPSYANVVVASTRINLEAGYTYCCTGGDVVRKPLSQNKRRKKIEVLAKSVYKDEPGWVYTLNKDGNVVRFWLGVTR